MIRIYDGIGDAPREIVDDNRTEVHNPEGQNRGLLGLALDPDFPDPALRLRALHARRGDRRRGAAVRAGGRRHRRLRRPAARRQRPRSGELPGERPPGAARALPRRRRRDRPHDPGRRLVRAVRDPLGRRARLRRQRRAVRERRRGRRLLPRGLRSGRDPGQRVRRPGRRGRSAARPGRCAPPPTTPGSAAAVIRVDPATGIRCADNPGRRRSRPQRASDRRLRAAQPVPIRGPARHRRALGRRRRLEHDRGDQPAAPGPRCATSAGPASRAVSASRAYDALDLGLCESLYAAPGGESGPRSSLRPRRRRSPRATAASAPATPRRSAGSRSSAGPSFPDAYDGALFFADIQRSCIWAIPDTERRREPRAERAQPLRRRRDLPGRRPVRPRRLAVLRRPVRRRGATGALDRPNGSRPGDAAPTAGRSLRVELDATAGRPIPNDASPALAFAWDLDGDGGYDDASAPASPTPTRSPAAYLAPLRVADPTGAPTSPRSGSRSPPVPAVRALPAVRTGRAVRMARAGRARASRRCATAGRRRSAARTRATCWSAPAGPT